MRSITKAGAVTLVSIGNLLSDRMCEKKTRREAAPFLLFCLFACFYNRSSSSKNDGLFLLVRYTYGIDACLRRYFSSRSLAELRRSDCRCFYLRLICFYLRPRKKERERRRKKREKVAENFLYQRLLTVFASLESDTLKILALYSL